MDGADAIEGSVRGARMTNEWWPLPRNLEYRRSSWPVVGQETMGFDPLPTNHHPYPHPCIGTSYHDGFEHTCVCRDTWRVLSHESDRVPLDEPLPKAGIQTRHAYLVRRSDVDVDTIWKVFSRDEGLEVGRH